MIRQARLSDIPAIEEVMRQSLVHLGPPHYDAAQMASAVRYIAIADRTIILDGTYYVVDALPAPHEAGGTPALLACGGWSKRGKLYAGPAGDDDRLLDPATEAARIRAMFVHPAAARRGLGRLILRASEEAAAAAGFRRVELMGMLPAIALYMSEGWEAVGETEIVLPDGMRLPCVQMVKELRTMSS